MDGLIIIDKPRGPSSFDVVRRVRSVAGMKGVGHTGTLDPDASGVLGVALGKCTKLSQFLTLERKEYEFEVVFGSQTDSDDAMGNVIATEATDGVAPESIEAAIPAFVGEVQQVPPKYSAIKVDGERAYDLARKGIEFELKARPVNIFEIQLLAWDAETKVASMRMACGPGTYVRSFARDLAQSLGTVAHARRIYRTKVGPFSIAQAVALDELDEESLREQLLSPAEMVAALSGVTLGEERCHAHGMGQRVVVGRSEFESDGESLVVGQPVAVHNQAGKLVSVSFVEDANDVDVVLKPKRVLQARNGPGTSERG